MTEKKFLEEQAIRRCDLIIRGFTTFENMREFAEICKQALEEIQQYRAIGTVEGYERAIQSSIENYNLYREYKAKVQEFEEIGTIEEFKALKEKSVAKKPEYAPTDDTCLYSEYVCPNCYIRLPNFRQKYCQCGQKLDC